MNFNLKDLIEQGMIAFDEEIEEIAECALREQNLESAKMKMEREWEHIVFKLMPFRNTGRVILADTQEI